MLRNRPAPSRATSTTLCQKCLKRGHYSYECVSSVQERPYTSRASWTQQLANPRLRPELDMSVPEEFIRKKSQTSKTISSQSDAKKGEDLTTTDLHFRGRSRSASFTSVSTISTNRSGSSRSPRPPQRSRHSRQENRVPDDRKLSDPSDKSTPHRKTHDDSDRYRGRKRGRSFSSSSSQQELDREPQIRRRRSSVSPALRGRPLYGNFKSDTSSSESRSHSRRYRNAAESGENFRHSKGRPKNTGRRGNNTRSMGVRDQRADLPGRERSPSPYTKRLMLTQAMNARTNS